MLAQLDLFASPVEENNKPEINRGRLTPPAVILMDEKSHPETQEETIEPVAEAVAGTGSEVGIPAAVKDEVAEISVEEKGDPIVNGKSTRGRKSIREMSRDAALVEIPGDEQLFSKQYYGIGEVAAMFNVNASLLRFWESEFDILKPRKNKKGDRFFRPEDIKNLQRIHHLLRERKYTIEGAREFLKKSGQRQQQFEAIESLKKIRTFLLELRAGL
jgi:DNA-binding transcriptional MerR regulator